MGNKPMNQQIILLGFVVFSLLLVACGSDNSSNGDMGSSSSGCTNTYGTNTVTDCRDGITYKTVLIGTQTWMAENLKYVVDSSWCYMNSADSCAKYGRLYSWDAAMAECPDEWHLPNLQEWLTLSHYVDANNGDEGIGMSLKSLTGWYNDGNGTDRFGFSALPASRRYNNGSFYDASVSTHFWSATENDSEVASYLILVYSSEGMIGGGYTKNGGFSVRCLKD